MSTAEKPPKLRLSYPLDLDMIERMTPEERAELDLPDHTQLPDKDGSFVQNYQEHPQCVLLTTSIERLVRRLYPGDTFLIGHDTGIYWRVTDPPLKGVKCPDWSYIPGVPPSPRGTFRRSYVLWKELVRPQILLEIVSGDGSEERDRTPNSGKFWVYEQVIRPTYYGIYEGELGRLEMHRHTGDHFEPMIANEHGRYPIEELGVELGLWPGVYLGSWMPWMRWWDAEGNLILTGNELAEIEAERATREAERAERETERAERETERAERLAAQLRALGIEPEA